MTQTFHSDGVPEWFTEAFGPLVRRHPQPLTADDAIDYWDVLKIAPERWVRAAVQVHLRESESPFMPQPATILKIARELQRVAINNRLASLPPCELCGTEGVVWVLSEKSRLRSDATACICERGILQKRKGLPNYEPGMITEADERRKLLAPGAMPAVKRITEDLAGSMEPRKPKSSLQQRREFNQWRAAKRIPLESVEPPRITSWIGSIPADDVHAARDEESSPEEE